MRIATTLCLLLLAAWCAAAPAPLQRRGGAAVPTPEMPIGTWRRPALSLELGRWWYVVFTADHRYYAFRDDEQIAAGTWELCDGCYRIEFRGEGGGTGLVFQSGNGLSRDGIKYTRAPREGR